MHTLIKPRSKTKNDDNLIPLINIVFLLLIFFMVAGKMLPPLTSNPILPSYDQAKESVRGKLQLELTAQGDWYLNGTRTTLDELKTQLETLQGNPFITLHAHKDTPTLHLNTLFALLRTLEFHEVQLITEEKGL